MSRIVYCADVVARYGDTCGPFVVVERLGSLKGLALSGGKQEKGEMLSFAARREFKEETGLSLIITGVLETRAEPNRDPRGDYVTTVFTGVATGEVRNEPDKTRVHLLTEEQILAMRDRFVLDHFDSFQAYLSLKEEPVSLN